MKFLCGSCRTKYQISDEKVRGKILTIRCKKCGAKILVRESLVRDAGGGTAVAPVAEQDQPKSPTRKSSTNPAAASAYASGKSVSSSSAPSRTGGSAALASAFEVAMGGATETDDMPTSIAPVPANLDNAGVEWYIAIDGEQHGPYAFAEVVRRVVAREAMGRHYVWHDGMDNWLRIRDVKDLNAFLPAEKKKPPPPPPASMDEIPKEAAPAVQPAAPGGNVVDFATKAKELGARRGTADVESADLLQDEDETRTDRPSVNDRAEQLDVVLNEALGIAGEDQTTRASPEGAVALQGTVEGGSEPSVDELISFEQKDIFANVPRASEADLVQRESTRFFVAAAGMNRRKSKNKIAKILGGVAVLAFLGFLGAWISGAIQISIPGLGNPFASNAADEADQYAAADGEENVDDLKKGLAGEKRRVLRKRKSRRRTKARTGGGFINDGPGESGSSGTRGGGEGAIGFEFGTSGGGTMSGLPDSKLPMSDVPLPDLGARPIDQSVIARVVNARKASVKICYQQSLKGRDDLRGKLEIKVTIKPSGSVSRAVVETSAFRGSRLGNCIADKIKNWKFPQFSGEPQDFVIPFVLQRGG